MHTGTGEAPFDDYVRRGLAPFVLITLCLLVLAPGPGFFLENTNHGYQLALGMTLAKGAVPGFDTITQYGPLVPVFSWLGWITTGNILGEVVICAMGYAASIAICCVFLRRHATTWIALAASAALLLLLAPFYKWYYWLVPLLGLVFAEAFRRCVLDGQAVRGLLLAWGLLSGLAWLVRIDLWMVALVFSILAMAAVHYERLHGCLPGTGWLEVRRFFRNAFLQQISGLAVPALFFILIAIYRGQDRVWDILYGLRDGVSDTVIAYHIRPFSFSLPATFTPENALIFGILHAHVFLQILIPAICAGCLLVAIRDLRTGAAGVGFPLLAAALTGFGILPQALHRADQQHLLQVLPPFILVAGLLLARSRMPTWLGWRRWAARSLLGFVVLSLLGLLPYGASDLAFKPRNPMAVWTELATLPDSRPTDPVADMAMAIRRLTPPDAKGFILLDMTPSPLIFFSERRQVGMFPIYEPGMYSDAYWMERNWLALTAEPPDFIVTASVPGPLPSAVSAELVSQWRARYKVILYRNDKYILLGP